MRFKKRKKKLNNKERLILLVGIAPIFIIVLFCIKEYLLATIFLVFFVGVLVLRNPATLGYLGERKVAKILKKLSADFEGKVINDVIIVDKENNSSQLDHVFINKSGIYVIETKRYSGRIYGKENDYQWTQVLAFGNVKNKLYNPVMQNETHIKRLNEIFENKYRLESIVVFVRNNIEYIESNNVYTTNGLRKYFKKRLTEQVLQDIEVEEIYAKIFDYKENPRLTKKEHIKNIKSKKFK